MAIQVQGNTGVVAEVDGTTYRGLRTVSKPIEYGAFGHYKVSQTIALVATQAANGTLFSFRWGDATRLCIIQKIKLKYLQTVAATATIMPSFQVFVARSFSVSDSVGTALTMTGNNAKKETTMGTSLVTDIRFATVAAGLTAGTRTLDANPIMEMPVNSTITTPNPTLYTDIVDFDVTDGVHPIELNTNEGIIVRGPTIVFGAAGAGNLVVEVSWAEVSSY